MCTFLKNMDWPLLREQWSALVRAIDDRAAAESEDEELLVGVLLLVEAMQDYAVAELGIEQDEVFHIEKGRDATNKESG